MFIIRYPTSSVDISKLIIYYTNFHDVDEETRTVIVHGGYWGHSQSAGIVHRNLDAWVVPTVSRNPVASKKNK